MTPIREGQEGGSRREEVSAVIYSSAVGGGGVVRAHPWVCLQSTQCDADLVGWACKRHSSPPSTAPAGNSHVLEGEAYLKQGYRRGSQDRAKPWWCVCPANESLFSLHFPLSVQMGGRCSHLTPQAKGDQGWDVLGETSHGT